LKGGGRADGGGLRRDDGVWDTEVSEDEDATLLEEDELPCGCRASLVGFVEYGMPTDGRGKLRTGGMGRRRMRCE
jgi:hypothetical protein